MFNYICVYTILAISSHDTGLGHDVSVILNEYTLNISTRFQFKGQHQKLALNKACNNSKANLSCAMKVCI